ncbi:MAG: preprotein translocase subunit YajC [Erythrobacter sp.]
MKHRRSLTELAHPLVLIASLAAMPLAAQDIGGGDGAAPGNAANIRAVQPYIEVNQVLTAQLSPGNDVITFTQVASGVDVNLQGRNSAIAASVRYERNIGYGDNSVDGSSVSGVVRGTLAVVPNTLNLEAGALGVRTRVDAGGGTTANPLVREDQTSQIYSVYAGPTLTERVGVVDVTAVTRVGYTRFELDNAVFDGQGNRVDTFDESVTYLGQVRAGVRPDDLLPVGIAVTAGGFQEDISNLDQRVRDLYARVDVTVPVTRSLALVGGVGYEDVEISSRDALRDANGNPIIGADGRFITDSAAPRILAFDVDGLLWDVGVLWRPSSRTSLAAHVGRRYASTIYYGNFTYNPSTRSALAIDVYDGVTGLGGVLNNSLARLSNSFEAVRNPVTGDFGGLVTGQDGAGGIGTLGSVRSAAFRSRGVRGSYQRQIGRTTAAIAAGYDRRTFIAAAGTVLGAANGLTDENYYLNAGLQRDIGRNANLTANGYINWFESGTDIGNVTATGASVAYNRSLSPRLVGRAAVGVDYFDSQFTAEDVAFATALLGLRYNF